MRFFDKICMMCKNTNFFGDQADTDGICASCRCPFCGNARAMQDNCLNCNQENFCFTAHVIDFMYEVEFRKND
jgi:hypothetical protein